MDHRCNAPVQQPQTETARIAHAKVTPSCHAKLPCARIHRNTNTFTMDFINFISPSLGTELKNKRSLNSRYGMPCTSPRSLPPPPPSIFPRRRDTWTSSGQWNLPSKIMLSLFDHFFCWWMMELLRSLLRLPGFLRTPRIPFNTSCVHKNTTTCIVAAK